MPVPSVYLDECVRHELAERLQVRGYHATTALAEGLLSVDDESQLTFATQHDLAILTHDARDFRRLHIAFRLQGGMHAGIILMPIVPSHQQEIRIAMMLDWMAIQSDYHNQLFRCHDLQYWLTQGNRLAGYSEADVRLALGQRA